jgi:sulfur carrier protein
MSREEHRSPTGAKVTTDALEGPGYGQVGSANRSSGREAHGGVGGAPTLAVNGTTHHLEAGTTVADLIATWCDSAEGVAVARNREVVPKSEWAVTALEAGDRVEIVTATAGG